MSMQNNFHDSVSSFLAERAGIIVCFGAQLTFERHYNAYCGHCEKRGFQPIDADDFMDVSNAIVNGLREWWYQKESGIYVIEEDTEG